MGSKMKEFIDDIFDNYDKNVYSEQEKKEIQEWINQTKELNMKLEKYDAKNPKKSLTFFEAIAKFFGAS